jgi:hypothetical protein
MGYSFGGIQGIHSKPGKFFRIKELSQLLIATENPSAIAS